MTHEIQTKIEARVFQQLIKHLETHSSVQNIDLMIVADFCRNCLSKWYLASAKELGVSCDESSAKQAIYGMPYDEWKNKYQKKATSEQLKQLNAKKIIQ
jgi:hypothetical protein